MAEASPAHGAEGLIRSADDNLQVDDNINEHDSAYNSEASASYLSSLKSSILHYKYENGRRYHAFREGSYLVPNDEEEQDRMDLAHHIYLLILGGELHLAPVPKDVERVLDLGTGTGIWAMEFADQHPSAVVIGTDLSPIQPKWTPPNCSFEVDDYESEWLYRKPFQFIHGRELEGCIANEDRFFEQAFKHLDSGGYLEMQASYPQAFSDDGSHENAVHVARWFAIMREGAAKFGKPWDVADKWKDRLERAGFVDVHQETRKLPCGTWPKDPKMKEIGRYQSVQQTQGIDSYSPAILSRVLGWSAQEIDVFLAKVKGDLRNPNNHLYMLIYFVWGRKP